MPIELTTHAAAPGRPLKHYWNRCVGAGRANEGLRAGWLEQMKMAVDRCGFQFVRFHGLFHDDMFVYREVDGEPVYNFQYIDDLFDRLLDIGIRPFVEFGFCPSELATEIGTIFWWKANGSPPKDYAKWGNLIHRTTQHWVDRYGIDEVKEWYFEVWNEPNLAPFFRGTRSQYFELYKTTVTRVKEVSPLLRVGGPATSNFVPDSRFDGEKEDMSCHAVVSGASDLDALEWKPVWLRSFFEYCADEKLPVDFISCHPYPTDWALDEHGHMAQNMRGVSSIVTDLELLRRMVDASPFPKAEIHLTEWNSSPSPRDHIHDYLPAATYVVKSTLEAAGLVDSLAYWTFTDVFEEVGGAETIFHGGFGMMNFQGIPKPTFHAYRMLHALGNELLTQVSGGVTTRDNSTGRLSALFYHYCPEVKTAPPSSFNCRDQAQDITNSGKNETIRLEWKGLKPGAQIEVEILDRESGNAVAAWEKLGSPAAPNRGQIRSLRTTAEGLRIERHQSDSSGSFVLEKELTPWSVLLVRAI